MTILNRSKIPSPCSVKGCKNTTSNYFESKKQKIYICDECFERLGDLAISRRTPKSPTNTIKRIIDQKQESIYD